MAWHEGAQRHEDDGLPNELKALLQAIAHQIESADMRHSSLLEEMRDRLAMLSSEAERVRGEVPGHFDAAFQRIEQGLRDLGVRLGGPDNEAAIGHAHAVSQEFGADVEPLALRSAGHSMGEVVRAAKHSSDVDTFDVIGDAGADDVWDTETAEALTQVYEDSDPVTASEPVHAFAPLMRPTLDAELDDVTAGIETAFVEESQVALDSEPVSSEIAAGPVEEMASVAMAAGQSRANDLQAREEDRAWLDQRLSEIAMRVENRSPR